MSTTPTPQVVTSYLAQLESSLRGVEPAVRDEIVAGVSEELQGLDAAAAATRIEELGDPEFIAAEARAASPVLPTSPDGAPEGAPDAAAAVATEPGHGYALFAAVSLMVGPILIPVVGAVIGLGLVVQTRAWSRIERLVTVLVPVLAVAIVLGSGALVAHSAGSSPLVPSTLWVAYVVLVGVCLVEGFVLMARGYGRRWRR